MKSFKLASLLCFDASVRLRNDSSSSASQPFVIEPRATCTYYYVRVARRTEAGDSRRLGTAVVPARQSRDSIRSAQVDSLPRRQLFRFHHQRRTKELDSQDWKSRGSDEMRIDFANEISASPFHFASASHSSRKLHSSFATSFSFSTFLVSHLARL